MKVILEDDGIPLEALDADLVAPGLLHELKQPLMGADAAATLLERVAGAELERHDEWRMLRGQLARLAEIVSGYEDLLRPVARSAPFHVGPVVTRAVDLLAHRVRPLAARFAYEPVNGALQGYGAPGALVHAATNLLANAVDAVEAGRGDGRVEVRVVPGAGDAVEVRVSDEGVGIPPELRDRIFDPRFTTKPPGKGSGLGLHVARRLMTRYGGSISLVRDGDPARRPWAVTEFCITVPSPPPGGAS